jgi:hypothetical protein
MNRYISKAFIAVCGFCVPIIMIGQFWALAPFMLAAVGIFYYSYANKTRDHDQK